MSRPAETPAPAPDVRGRTVVWSAGSWAATGAGRTRHPFWRSLGLALAATTAVFALAYAVHAWVILAPPPAGASVPLWLPEQLPADQAAAVVDPPSAHPTAARTVEARVARRPVVVEPSRPSAPRGGERAATSRSTTSGHGPSRRSSSGSGSEDHHGSSGSSGSSGHASSSSSSSSGRDDSGSGSHGSSSSGSSGGSSGHGGSGHGGSDGSGSGHGSDDGGAAGGGSKGAGSKGGGSKGGGSGHGGSDDHEGGPRS